MRVSIVIRNYNYAEFLRDALDGALAQTHPDTEVVVVDDGSTDDSRTILSAYASRCRVVQKDNGGEGDSINAGFANASGDIVIFLDSDDVLAPNAASEIVSVWDADIARVHFRLWAMDREGYLFPDPLPSFEVPNLELAEAIRLFGHAPSTAQSSNAYARGCLARILPLDAGKWRRAPDIYLNTLSLALGRSKFLQQPLGGYRLHDSSLTVQNTLRVAQRDDVVLAHPRLFEALRAFVGPSQWETLAPRFPTYHWLNRVLSYRLNPAHPFPDDRIASLAAGSAHAIVIRPQTSFLRRMLLLGGLGAICLLPKSLLARALPGILRTARTTSLPRSMRRKKALAQDGTVAHWRQRYGIG